MNDEESLALTAGLAALAVCHLSGKVTTQQANDLLVGLPYDIEEIERELVKSTLAELREKGALPPEVMS